MTPAQRDQTLCILGAPMDLGAGRRGVDMGPSAIRVAGIGDCLRGLGFTVHDAGNVEVPTPEQDDPGEPSAKYLTTIRAVCDQLRLRVHQVMGQGQLPVVLGGDHSIAIGTVAGVAEHFRDRDQRVGLVWVDAHADMNTPESSPSGNIHGMPLATCLGLGEPSLVGLGGFSPKVARENVALIGIRNLDEKEKQLVRSSGIHAYTMRDIDVRGMSAVVAEAIEHASAGTAGFHVSFDLDSMDPRHVPGVGTAVKGGLSWREGNLLLEMVADAGRMTSLEITELNPVLDVRNQSGEVAVELAGSAFGKRIL
ncbi:MAG: arginase [Planctomycetota bacterium]